MKSDTLIKSDGLRVLAENLGIVEAERFVTLLLREPFDYTEWQKDLYRGETVTSLFDKIKAFEKGK
jgi:hypothetical protein